MTRKNFVTSVGGAVKIDGSPLEVVQGQLKDNKIWAQCPSCHGERLTELCDFVQFGFRTDMHDVVYACVECENVFVYEVEVMA